MSFDARIGSVREALAQTTFTETFTDDGAYFIQSSDPEAQRIMAAWYAKHRTRFGGMLTELSRDVDRGYTDDKVLIMRRPLCKHCQKKWRDHVPKGHKCLFSATSYEEPPL